jgi:hypothetical protein
MMQNEKEDANQRIMVIWKHRTQQFRMPMRNEAY